jgi:hypothetical protein
MVNQNYTIAPMDWPLQAEIGAWLMAAITLGGAITAREGI